MFTCALASLLYWVGWRRLLHFEAVLGCAERSIDCYPMPHMAAAVLAVCMVRVQAGRATRLGRL